MTDKGLTLEVLNRVVKDMKQHEIPPIMIDGEGYYLFKGVKDMTGEYNGGCRLYSTIEDEGHAS